MRSREGRVAGALVVLVAGAAAVGVLVFRHGRPSATTATTASTTVASKAAHDPHRLRRFLRLAERQIGRLQSPVQDAAAASVAGGRTLLLGGLTAADTSRADVRIVSASRDSPAGVLPSAVHDAAAVRLGKDV